MRQIPAEGDSTTWLVPFRSVNTMKTETQELPETGRE